MCFPLERGVHFCKNTNKLQNETACLQTNMCIAIKSRQQKAPDIKKLQNCKCDKFCRFADRALEAKLAHVTSENQNLDGRLVRNRSEQKKFTSDKCQKDGPVSAHLKPSMLQKVNL